MINSGNQINLTNYFGKKSAFGIKRNHADYSESIEGIGIISDKKQLIESSLMSGGLEKDTDIQELESLIPRYKKVRGNDYSNGNSVFYMKNEDSLFSHQD